jgi:hypothetical protein
MPAVLRLPREVLIFARLLEPAPTTTLEPVTPR